MTGFKNDSNITGLLAWKGDPDDETAHQVILEWLRTAVTSGFHEQQAAVSNRVKGNLGEFIAYRIGDSYVFTNGEIAPTANAFDPLSEISRPDIDIVWLYFGDTEYEDWAALQEVKTTGQSSLQLADILISDYDKLFGESLRVTLQTRLGALKNRLDQWGYEHLSPRLTTLGGPNPNEARGIRLIPTLIHDAAYISVDKMTTVRQALIGRGWSSDSVECWSIELDDLDERLISLARGQ